MAAPALLHGFAYGEHLDIDSQRTLGTRLLAPAAPQPWGKEVEALARALQAAPYPDAWPPADLFCSVLLATGGRLVAVARYGLTDHTRSGRRGCLELIGIVGPADMDTTSALAVYRWLRQRRAEVEDLSKLGGEVTLAEAVAAVPPAAADGPPPVLPIRVWQSGVLLFAAPSPSAPDRALKLLEQVPPGNWQWVPLCGPEFPLQTYAQRGPLVAWTPHLLEVAVKLEPPSAPPAPAVPQARWWAAGLAGLLLVLLGANLWAVWSLPGRIEPGRPITTTEQQPGTGRVKPPPAKSAHEQEARERFALALYRLLREQDGGSELVQGEAQLIERYRGLAEKNPDLRIEGQKAQAAVGLVSVLGRHSAESVARLIHEEFQEKKGYDPELIELISQRVRRRLLADAGKSP